MCNSRGARLAPWKRKDLRPEKRLAPWKRKDEKKKEKLTMSQASLEKSGSNFLYLTFLPLPIEKIKGVILWFAGLGD
jgi:hypothetical protein